MADEATQDIVKFDNCRVRLPIARASDDFAR